MGNSKSTSESSSTQTQQTTFANATPEELALRQQFTNLGTSQAGAIQSLLDKIQSGNLLNLSPADQARLDQAYNAARQQLQLEGKDYADFLSGSRGLRMSDTPISSQALQRYGLGLSQLESDRALAGLNLGLQANQLAGNMGLAAAGSLPAGSLAAFNPLFSERMAGGKTTMTGQSSSTTTVRPSLMSQIGQGIQLAGSLGSMGAGFMTGLPGLGLSGVNAPGLANSATYFGPANH